MKLVAVVACLAFLYGVSSETLDLHNNAELEAFPAQEEWDDAVLMVWAEDQTDEGWSQAHTLAWVYGTPEHITDVSEYEETETIDCSCNGNECSCCWRFRIFFIRFNACLVASVSNGEICAAAKLNSHTLVRHCISVSLHEVRACKNVLGRQVCGGLTGITVGHGYISAHGFLEVQGIFHHRIGTVRLSL